MSGYPVIVDSGLTAIRSINPTHAYALSQITELHGTGRPIERYYFVWGASACVRAGVCMFVGVSLCIGQHILPETV